MTDGPVARRARIRVAHLIDTLEVGGAEKQLVTVATGLDRGRFDPVVICLTRLGPFAGALEAAGVPVRLVAKRHKLDLGALGRLRALVRAEAPDILQTWMFTCNLFGRLAARGLPVVTVASEVSVDRGKSRLRLMVDRVLARGTPAFYVNSGEVARFYEARCAIPRDKLVVIPNGVIVRDVAPVERASLSVPAQAFLVGAAGRLGSEKGFDGLIQAMAHDALARRGAHLVIAGEGPLRETLRAEAERRGVSDRVRLLGYRDDLPAVIAALDAFVLSSHFEGMPNALMEAMAQGKPCVATRVGGVEELMVDGESGLVVPRSDAALLGGAVARLIEAPEVAARLGRAGRARMAAHFSVEANVHRFEQLYTALLGGDAAGHAGVG